MEFDLNTRLSLLFAFFIAFAILEHVKPLRSPNLARAKRWPGNIGLFAVDVIAIGLPLNGLVFFILLWTEHQGVGLMNILDLPYWIKIMIGVLALDALMYFQHRLSHAQPLLWRLHKVHHADTEMDVTTANRVHPFETLWISILRMTLVVLLGIPMVAFVIFIMTLNVISLFNHVNLSMPKKIEHYLRKLIVTPMMHETHHSAHSKDFDKNFAFIFSFWDRLFQTYKAETEKVDGKIILGLDEFRGSHETQLTRLLTMPFRVDKSN
jgi:sterol desaturase/sphingolipid hydroxylase (fatty acid hydroxylase superfamily)